MSVAKSRLSGLLGHFTGSKDPRVNHHTLSPTFFLPRAAAIEPDVSSPVSNPVDYAYAHRLTDTDTNRPKQSTMSQQITKSCEETTAKLPIGLEVLRIT